MFSTDKIGLVLIAIALSAGCMSEVADSESYALDDELDANDNFELPGETVPENPFQASDIARGAVPDALAIPPNGLPEHPFSSFAVPDVGIQPQLPNLAGPDGLAEPSLAFDTHVHTEIGSGLQPGADLPAWVDYLEHPTGGFPQQYELVGSGSDHMPPAIDQITAAYYFAQMYAAGFAPNSIPQELSDGLNTLGTEDDDFTTPGADYEFEEEFEGPYAY